MYSYSVSLDPDYGPKRVNGHDVHMLLIRSRAQIYEQLRSRGVNPIQTPEGVQSMEFITSITFEGLIQQIGNELGIPIRIGTHSIADKITEKVRKK